LNDLFLVAERFLELIDMPVASLIAMGSVVICLVASSLGGKLLLAAILQLILRKPIHELPAMLSTSDDAHEPV
jgi:hypothetical protein